MRTDRHLFPNVDGLKPPPAVVKAEAQVAKTKEARKKATAEIREAELALRSAKREDMESARNAVAGGKPTPKAIKPDRERAVQDARRRGAAAVQLVREAEARLAEEIRKAQPEVIEQIDTDARAERILSQLDQVGAEIERLEDEAGAILTVLEVEDDRRQSRGHEPLRLRRDRLTSPSGLLAELRGYTDELRQAAQRLKAKASERVAA